MKRTRPALAAAAADRHAEIHAQFVWQVPAQFNIAEACCGRWARTTPQAIAIHAQHENGARATLSYGQLQQQANRLANALQRLGVQRGERVAIVMPQRCETAVAQIAVAQLGAVAEACTLAGGQVRNVVLDAVSAGLSRGRVVDAELLFEALQREYRRSGGLCPLKGL